MNKTSSTSLQLAGWIQRNLHVTTVSMSLDDAKIWEKLFEEDPEQAADLAAYGYGRRQVALYGHAELSSAELQEFVQEYKYKLQLVLDGSVGVKLPMFEYSIRHIRHQRQAI